jgi:hypothetical protein
MTETGSAGQKSSGVSQINVDSLARVEKTSDNELFDDRGGKLFRFEILLYLIVLFVIVYVFAYFAGDNLLPADGKFSLISETYYLPLKLAYSFCVTGLTYLIISSYHLVKKGRFLWLLLFTLFVEQQIMENVMSSTLAGWLQINMQLDPKVEYALVFAAFVTYLRIVYVALVSLRSQYQEHVANYKIIVSAAVSVIVVVMPFVLSKYAADNYDEAQKNLQAFRIPNSKLYAVEKEPSEPIDASKTQWSYRLKYPQLVTKDGNSYEIDDLYITKAEYGKSLDELCGSSDYLVTDFGLNYGVTINQRNGSVPPKDESKYLEKYICFRIGEGKYLLRRSNAYGYKSYELYSDDKILAEFFNDEAIYHQRAIE